MGAARRWGIAACGVAGTAVLAAGVAVAGPPSPDAAGAGSDVRLAATADARTVLASPRRRGADDGAGDDRGGDRRVRDVRRAGTCTASSSAKITLSPENGRIEVELEVDENRVGRRWGIVLRQNGRVVARRSARTGRPSGAFTVRTVVPNRRGRDGLVGVARQLSSGERCRAAARFTS